MACQEHVRKVWLLISGVNFINSCSFYADEGTTLWCRHYRKHKPEYNHWTSGATNYFTTVTTYIYTWHWINMVSHNYEHMVPTCRGMLPQHVTSWSINHNMCIVWQCCSSWRLQPQNYWVDSGAGGGRGDTIHGAHPSPFSNPACTQCY